MSLSATPSLCGKNAIMVVITMRILGANGCRPSGRRLGTHGCTCAFATTGIESLPMTGKKCVLAASTAEGVAT